MVARSGLFVAPAAGPVGATPTDARLALSALTGTTPQQASGGVTAQSASTMVFTVPSSVWQLPDVTNAGATFLAATDPFALTATAGPATGSRIDLICVKQNNVENSDADSRVNVVLVTGIAGAPGVAPATPAGAWVYQTITVPTSAANAAACTVTTPRPSTFGALPIKATTLVLLNLVTGVPSQHATVTGDATAVNGDYLWVSTQWVKANVAAVTPAVPSSVSGTSVVASSSGKVTFTAATGVNLNFCFSSTADKFDIVFDILGMSTPGQLTMNLRLNGVDNGSANYDWEVAYGSGASSAATGGAAATAWQLTAGATGSHSARLTIFNPNQSALKRLVGQTVDYTGAGAPVVTNVAAGFRVATPFDGFSLYAPGGGTFSGAISVEAHLN